MTTKLKVLYRKAEELIPSARNARTHSDEQIAQVAASIREFGFTNPILVDGESGVIAGHGRLIAAQRLGMDSVPTIALADMTEAQRRAYVITDNKLAENAGWDNELLALELGALSELDFDIALTGFDAGELADLQDRLDEEKDNYSRKIVAPIYEIKGEKPAESDLMDCSKTTAIIKEIDAADIPEEVADFLRHAAQRHTVFDFAKIAEYYAHADKGVQTLMENSALIIIDFDKAIELGFVTLSKELLSSVGVDERDQVGYE